MLTAHVCVEIWSVHSIITSCVTAINDCWQMKTAVKTSYPVYPLLVGPLSHRLALLCSHRQDPCWVLNIRCKTLGLRRLTRIAFTVFAGSLPIPFQLRPEGSFEKFAAGGLDQALRQPQEWSQWYQGSQVVCYHWLDCHLPEEGEASSLTVEVCTNGRIKKRCEKLLRRESPSFNSVMCFRWKLPLFPSARALVTQATLMTMRKKKSESPSQRSVQRSFPSSRFEPWVEERKRERQRFRKLKGI